MGTQIQLRHVDFIAFLRGKSDEALDREVAQLRKGNPEYEMLFEMAEEIRKSKGVAIKAGIEDKPKKPMSFGEVDHLLLDIYAGTATHAQKQQFMDHLLSSGQFYERLLANFNETNQVLQEAEKLAKNGQPLGSKSNEALLEAAGIIPPIPIEPVTPPPLWEKLQAAATAAFENFQGSIRYATAAVAFAVVVFGIGTPMWLASINPYNDVNYDRDKPFAYLTNYRNSDVFNPTRSGERGQIESATTSMLIDTIDKMKFKMNQHIETPYNQLDYQHIITTGVDLVRPISDELEKMIDEDFTALGLEDSLGIKRLTAAKEMVQNFYFYSGVSGLAIYRSDTKDITDEVRDHHLANAIEWLTKAKKLAKKYDKSPRDREHYFLGMALAYQYLNDQAISEFRMVNSESPLYEKAMALKSWLED